MKLYKGGCACGQVRYEVSAEPLGSGQCYCRDCQYTCGGGPANAFVVPQAKVKITQGEVTHYECATAKGGRSTRQFCPRCGTPLFGDKSSNPGLIVIMAGSLDDPGVFKPTTVGWVSTAQAWAHIDPELKPFDRDVGG